MFYGHTSESGWGLVNYKLTKRRKLTKQIKLKNYNIDDDLDQNCRPYHHIDDNYN